MPATVLANQARAKHQLMADDLGVRKAFLEDGKKRPGPNASLPGLYGCSQLSRPRMALAFEHKALQTQARAGKATCVNFMS